MGKFFNDTFKLGILGGGQLGRMLIQKAIDLNVAVSVLDPDEHAPCRAICDEFVHGHFNDFDSVYYFGKKVNVLTIEIEHVHVEALEKLESEGLEIYPQPKIIKLVQDKGSQKIFYRTNKIPTAEFQLIENKNELKNYAHFLPFVQKLRKGGYDGKGVQVMKSKADFEKGFDAPSVLEKFVDLKCEIAVIVARNRTGEMKSFPVTQMEFNQEGNLVDLLFSPADVSEKISEVAKNIAEKIALDSGIVGVLAVELFVTKKDEVLVNEIAPRPHNSGHHTIEANVTSQYEQHLRAILNLPLGSTESIHPAVMVNLLGEKNYSGAAVFEGLEKVLAKEGVHVHLYGKKFTKPLRKMGHVTCLADTMEEAFQKAKFVKENMKVIA